MLYESLQSKPRVAHFNDLLRQQSENAYLKSENHRKLRKSDNREKQPKTAGNIDFSMFKIHFRSADAANH